MILKYKTVRSTVINEQYSIITKYIIYIIYFDYV